MEISRSSRVANPETRSAYEVLLVEDNPADARMFQLAFQECHTIHIHVSILGNSRDVMDYLYARGTHAGANKPHLIILDYHMPLDGGRALAELKGDPNSMCIPVLVVTGTNNPVDVDDIYRRHANACFARRSDLDSIVKLLCNIANHWLTEVMLPPPAPHAHTLEST